ncbi:MAG: hypothetical protein AVDCRST_MAG61-2314, partial [uncultured Friedmanniella sp.]
DRPRCHLGHPRSRAQDLDPLHHRDHLAGRRRHPGDPRRHRARLRWSLTLVL